MSKETKTDRLEAQDRPNYLKWGELHSEICKYKKCGKRFETHFVGLEHCMPAHRSWDSGSFADCYDAEGNFTPKEKIIFYPDEKSFLESLK